MKKIKLLLFLLLATVAVTMAQPKAIGLRFGYNSEVSYQHSIGSNFIQLDAGTYHGFRGINFSPTYNFSIAKPNWTSKGEWEWYAGPSLSTGYYFGYNSTVLYDNGHDDFFYLGVGAMVGLSYTFWFPLQLSVDFRPTLLGFNTRHHLNENLEESNVSLHSDFFYQDWNGKIRGGGDLWFPNIAISARYAFGK